MGRWVQLWRLLVVAMLLLPAASGLAPVQPVLAQAPNANGLSANGSGSAPATSGIPWVWWLLPGVLLSPLVWMRLARRHPSLVADAIDAIAEGADSDQSEQKPTDADTPDIVPAQRQGLISQDWVSIVPPVSTETANSVTVSKAVPEPADIAATTVSAAPRAFTTSPFTTPLSMKKPISDRPVLDMATLATVDDGLPELPEGYNESRIVLMPRDPEWAYTYWDISNEHKAALRNQGGRDLALRLYDATDVDLEHQAPHNMQQYAADEMARNWYMPIPVSDRDYIAEIGYQTADGRWLVLARSAPAHIPPVFPSDWVDDQFLTLDWSEDLRGQTFMTLVPPGMTPEETSESSPIHDAIFAHAGDSNALRVAGSLFGSMQQVPASVLSSFAIPSGLTELPGVPGVPMPNFSGLNMSGLNMSGVGFSADFVPPRPRKFWLVADAELIVYGATEPDATVTVGGKEVKLSSDGTFRFQMSFQDGELDFPIHATASDGEQTRNVEMDFTRETPSRNTNTKDDAKLEWFE